MYSIKYILYITGKKPIVSLLLPMFCSRNREASNITAVVLSCYTNGCYRVGSLKIDQMTGSPYTSSLWAKYVISNSLLAKYITFTPEACSTEQVLASSCQKSSISAVTQYLASGCKHLLGWHTSQELSILYYLQRWVDVRPLQWETFTFVRSQSCY